MKGIFKVLDDTGKMQCQTNLLFLQNIILNWKNNQILAKPKPQKVQVSDGFIIRHYVGDVFYNVVRIAIFTTFKIICNYFICFIHTFHFKE